jgi:hypothetical protein
MLSAREHARLASMFPGSVIHVIVVAAPAAARGRFLM